MHDTSTSAVVDLLPALRISDVSVEVAAEPVVPAHAGPVREAVFYRDWRDCQQSSAQTIICSTLGRPLPSTITNAVTSDRCKYPNSSCSNRDNSDT